MSAPVKLELHFLGQGRVCIDGAPIRFAKRSVTLAMLAYLSLGRKGSVSRETLAFTLFPDLPETEAFKELRRYLYLTQKALPADGGPWIEADGDTLRWNAAVPVHIDVLAFEKLAASPPTFAAAVDAYEGDLLPEIYDDWIVAERERLRTAYLEVLSSLIAACRSSRDYPRAIGYAQRLLAQDPWREDTVRQLIATRYEHGDAAGAIAEYERFARSTRIDLGVEPMPETRALRDIVARGGLLPSSLDRAIAPIAARRTGGLPFAGRHHALERLRHAWERTARAGGALVAIEGEPGVGKSRLAAEFALLAEAEGGRVLAGTTSFPEFTPYQSVVEALRAGLPLLRNDRGDRLRSRILAQILPEWQTDESRLDQLPQVEPSRQQGRLFDAIGSTIEALARLRPLCLILEDLHWAGRGTLELLRTLARRAANAAILTIVTFRDEEVGADHPLRAMIRDLAAEGLAIRVALGPLTRADIDGVVSQLAGASHVELDASALFAQSEGNPLFLSEAIAEALDPAGTDGAAHGMHGVIERRLNRLSPEARRVAAVAAICGNAFDADVACSAAGASGARGLAAIDELLERQIVRENGAAAGFGYAFSHHLIAAALYSSLDPDERIVRHSRVAHVLERYHQRQLDGIASEIARHHAAAGEHNAAAQWYARAARAAGAIFAHDEAARFVRLALDHGPPADEITGLLLLLETAHARLGRRAEQAQDLDALDVHTTSFELRCESLRRRIALLRTLTDREAERAAIDALQARAAGAGDRHWLGVAQCASAWLEISLGHYAAAEPLALSSLEHLTAAGDCGERIDALSALIEINVATGRGAAAEALLERAAETAREARDDRTLANVLMQAVAAAVSAQQFDRALSNAARAVELYRTLGDRVGEAGALVNVAAAAVRQSQWEAARNANLGAAATFELCGDARGLARVFMNLAMLHGRCGDIETGRNYLLRARDHQRRLQDDRAVTASLLNESFLALWQGRPDEAFALATEALARAEQMNHASYRAQALANLGAAERDLGLLGAGLAHMEAGLEQQLALSRLPDAVSDLADVALAHAMNGDLDRALEHVERILHIDRSWTNAAIFPPFPPWVAARVLRARADDRARPVLAWAVQLTNEFSASIDVPDLRSSFVAMPFVADIRAAAAQDRWPPFTPTVAAARHAGGTTL